MLANAFFHSVDFHSSVLAFQHLLYVQVIISLHFRILDTPTEHVFTNLVFAFYFSDLIFWCSLAEAIFRILAFYRSLLPSQILSYDHNIMSLHFRTLHTPTEHVFANLVCVFSVSRSHFLVLFGRSYISYHAAAYHAVDSLLGSAHLCSHYVHDGMSALLLSFCPSSCKTFCRCRGARGW